MKKSTFGRALWVSSVALGVAACGGATEDGESLDWSSSALTGTDYTPSSSSSVLGQYVAPVSGEGYGNLIDNNVSTKLFVGKNHFWVRYQMTRPTTIASYDIKSGNDFENRDPKNWTFEGSLDGLRWVVLDTRSNQTFSGRQVTNSYTFSNSTPYLYYRLNVSANQDGKNETQLSELRVGGSQPAGTVPATVTNVAASVSGTSATVTWSAVSGATGYYVQRIADDGTSATEFTTSSTSYTDSNLGRGVPYLYRVQAYSGSLRGFPSATSNRIVTAGGATGLKDLTALSSFAPTDQYSTTGDEGVEKITDNAIGTKYLTFNPTTWIQQRTAASSVVTQYTITSGNDSADRDPLSWTLEGSTSGAAGSWTVIDTRTNQGFSNRHQTRVFTANPSNLSFSYYRLNVTANHGAGITQLAEWRLFSSTGGSVVAPSAPTGLSATALTGNQIKLTWADAAGKLNPESSYTVERATDSGFTTNLVSRTTGSGSDEFRSTSLAASQTYYFRVRANNAAGSSAWVTTTGTTPAATVPPATWQETGWYGGHDRPLTRRPLDSDIAVYVDQYISPTTVDWLRPILNQNFGYAKSAYGSFSDHYLYVVAEQDGRPEDVNDIYGIGGLIGYDDPIGPYRNITFAASWDWADQNSGWNVGALTHELAHVVEATHDGWFESPSFSAWGDSKWADIFIWDVYSHSTLLSSTYVNNAFTELNQVTDDWGNYWFRDFLYPLYAGNLGNTDPSRKGGALYDRYFDLLVQYLPKLDSRYAAKNMTLGEFIHFMSGAAQVNLEAQAKIAFRWSPELELQLANAQLMFPEVHALYSGTSCTPETDVAFCSRLGATCGSVTAADNCGTSRTVTSCGSCTSPQTCGGGGTANVCGGGSGTTPCASLCSSPVTFTSQSYQSGNLGTAATCHETTANIAGLVCGNFSSSRIFNVNGTAINCAGSVTLPAKRNGGYCFQASSGDYAWAYFSTW